MSFGLPHSTASYAQSTAASSQRVRPATASTSASYHASAAAAATNSGSSSSRSSAASLSQRRSASSSGTSTEREGMVGVQKLFGKSVGTNEPYSSTRLAYIPLELLRVTAEEKSALNALQPGKVSEQNCSDEGAQTWLPLVQPAQSSLFSLLRDRNRTGRLGRGRITSSCFVCQSHAGSAASSSIRLNSRLSHCVSIDFVFSLFFSQHLCLPCRIRQNFESIDVAHRNIFVHARRRQSICAESVKRACARCSHNGRSMLTPPSFTSLRLLFSPIRSALPA